jgi:hypothetical protein
VANIDERISETKDRAQMAPRAGTERTALSDLAVAVQALSGTGLTPLEAAALSLQRVIGNAALSRSFN